MRHFIKIGLLIVSVVALSGCEVGVHKPSADKAREAVSKLIYIQDPRTGICYSAVSTSHQNNVSDDGMTMTYVPCTPKVLAVLDK